MGTVKLKINIALNWASKSSFKQLLILDKDLKIIFERWLTENSIAAELQPALYLIRVVLPNGKKTENIVDIKDGKAKTVRLGEDKLIIKPSRKNIVINSNKADKKTIKDKTKPSANLQNKVVVSRLESIGKKEGTIKGLGKTKGFITRTELRENISLNENEKQIVVKGQVRESKIKIIDVNSVTGAIWHENNGVAHIDLIPRFKDILINSNEKVFNVNVHNAVVSRFQITGKKGISTIVLLPPVGKLKLKVRAAAAPEELKNFYDVSVVLPDLRAQALLELLYSGEINRAKSLMENYDIAENLLYNKITDPSSAAIGGYFLLKTKQLDRLHGWARNLADFFPWLPDGSIIYAWQMLLKNGDLDSIEIRNRLLEAIERGYPVFTEGLRLLYDGLVRCSFYFGNDDAEVKDALAKVKVFISKVDFSQETTTYTLEETNFFERSLYRNWLPY